MWKSLLFLNGLTLATMTAALAAVEPASNAVSDPALGTTVISQKMTFKNQESQAVFDGAVVLTRGTLVVYSDIGLAQRRDDRVDGLQRALRHRLEQPVLREFVHVHIGQRGDIHAAAPGLAFAAAGRGTCPCLDRAGHARAG